VSWKLAQAANWAQPHGEASNEGNEAASPEGVDDADARAEHAAQEVPQEAGESMV